MLSKSQNLHILNGDLSLKLLESFNDNCQTLVWKETYIEGPLEDTDQLALFQSARAKYLASFKELANISEEQLFLHLKKLDDTILTISKDVNVTLWFDSCIFDQTILMRILYLFAIKTIPLPKVFLYCCNSNCLTLDDFKIGFTDKVELLPEDFQLGKNAWLAFLRKDSSQMLEIANNYSFERLRPMKKALQRCAEEVPNKNNLTRTQRQILQTVATGKHNFKDIFAAIALLEEYPFLGDTACQRILDDLVQRDLLVVVNDNYHLK